MSISPIKFLLSLLAIFFIFCGVVVIFVNDIISSGLPSLEQLENPRVNQATQVLSADKELLDYYYIQRRVNLSLDSIPKDFTNALIATEDRAFYDHWGVHMKRIFTMFIKNIVNMRIKEGGSTLTMQLARNMFLNHESSLERKIREVFVAIQIEKTYTKNEILEMYCNTVAFGRGAYGIQVASQVYFDKTPMELTTAECALLVGLLKAPEKYNGVDDKEKALRRRNLVLSLMNDQGFLGGNRYLQALEEPIILKTGRMKKAQFLIAPHFVEMVRQKLTRNSEVLNRSYDLYRDGLTIHTTINSKIQQYANQAVEEHLLELQQLFEKTWSWKNNQKLFDDLVQKAINNQEEYQAAPSDKKKSLETKLKNNRKFIDSVKNAAITIQTGLVVINPFNGAILAMVGCSPKFIQEHSDFKYSLNHASQIQRQPGSAFKPFTYSACLEHGTSPDTMVECGPYSYKLITGEVWSPGGSACDAGEKVNLYDALKRSINSVAARLVTHVTTPEAVVNIARRMGINSPLRAVPAIALGAGGEVSPLEMVSAYGTFPNNGYHVEPYFITKIEDHLGNVLYEKKNYQKVTDAIQKHTCNTMIKLMEGVVSGGTGYRVRHYFKDIDAAGKTGTTNDNADTWFIGFTPELVAGAWVGFDDRRITFGSYGEGGRASAPIWGRLMAKIYNDQSLHYQKKRFDFNISDSTKDKIIEETYMSHAENLKREKQERKEKKIPKSEFGKENSEKKEKHKFPSLKQNSY